MTELAALIEHLVTLTPDTPEAEKQQAAIESLLMASLADGGREAGEQMVDSLTTHGYKLERLDGLPCMWRVTIPRPRVLELWFTGGEQPVVAALSYRVGTPWGSKKQKRAAERQTAFYARYQNLCPPEHGLPPALEPLDRLILFVGDLEADVNNGGFGQYLANKGVQRANETLAYLDAIGARRTARSLLAALQADVDAATLEGLDQRFYDHPEDLASLAMQHIERQAKR